MVSGDNIKRNGTFFGGNATNVKALFIVIVDDVSIKKSDYNMGRIKERLLYGDQL